MKYNVKKICIFFFLISLPLIHTLKSFSEGNMEDQLKEANAYIEQNEFFKAETIMQKVIASEPENLEALKTMVLVLYYQKKREEALILVAHIYETNKEIIKNPDFVELAYLEALINFELGEKTKTLEILNRIFETYPDHKKATSLYCSVLAEIGNSNESKACLKKLSSMD